MCDSEQFWFISKTECTVTPIRLYVKVSGSSLFFPVGRGSYVMQESEGVSILTGSVQVIDIFTPYQSQYI
jgi:hypothetical protein